MMRKSWIKWLVMEVCLLMSFASIVYSHCQIPCGIYGDEARFETINEHIKTIEKSMMQIVKLSAEAKPDMNQIVRWVQNKDKHADELSEIVTYYFMAQRIKPCSKDDKAGYEKYAEKLTLLHKMLRYSMKCKQGTELKNVEKLKRLTEKFHAAYFGKEVHEHKH